jgi:hypothetical protein
VRDQKGKMVQDGGREEPQALLEILKNTTSKR